MRAFLLLLLSTCLFAANEPDMKALSTVGKVIHSEHGKLKTDKGWIKDFKLMQGLEVFDAQILRIMMALCSEETNKSFLIVGEPTKTFRYYFARLASMVAPSGCARQSHVEISPSKLQGYMYSGTTDRLWKEKIETPAYNKDVVLYFNNLSNLIGIGTHSNQDTGIESRFADAITAGKLKSVAFLNKFDYNRLYQSRHAYVLNAFKETIKINQIDMMKVDKMVRRFFQINAPQLTISERVYEYLYKTVEYYQPNLSEPERSLTVSDAMIRDLKENTKESSSNVASPSPYTNKFEQEYKIERKGAKSISIVFEYFETENGRDVLTVFDAKTDKEIGRISGKKGEYRAGPFSTDSLKLKFKTDTSEVAKGFKVAKVIATFSESAELGFADVRDAVMKAVQIPAWMMNRDYQVVRELFKKLDDDVVGVAEGKVDVVKQVKIGYVSGRTDEKPAGSLMFVGPTGTGKSYISKKVAEFMGMRLITLDMTQYSTEDSFDRFLNVMSNYLVVYPYAFYLFEEIDKANFKVLDRLYFMLDEGIFFDKHQQPLFARGAFVMMTTNAGHQLIIKEQNNPKLRELVNEELQKHYRPSFLNRFDAISIFKPFSNDEFFKLANIMTSKKITKMKEYFDWTVEVDMETIQFMGQKGRSKLYGARPMERTVENTISLGVSEYQINVGTIDFGSKISITKMAGFDNKFEISVEGGESIMYEVEFNTNSGDKSLGRLSPQAKEVLDVFKSDRVFDI